MLRPDLNLPVDALGELAIRSPSGVELALRAESDTLRLEVRSLTDLLRLVRELPSRADRRRLAARAQALGRVSSLGCVIALRRREIARIDSAARGSWLARLLGLGPVRLRLMGFCGSPFSGAANHGGRT